MKTKININVNGKNFEALVDTSLLLGMMGPEKFNKVNVPMPVSLPRENSIETPNEGLENSPFWLEEVTKINRALMALHQRLRVLEETAWSPHPRMPTIPFGVDMVNKFMEVLKNSDLTRVEAKPKKQVTNKPKSTTKNSPNNKK